MKRQRKASGPYSSPPEELARAKQFLVDILGSGPRLSKEVGEAAEEKGIGHMLFFHARKELSVKAHRVSREGEGTGFVWQLSLPGAPVAKSLPHAPLVESKPVAVTTNGNGTHALIQAVEAQTAQLEQEIAGLKEKRAFLEAEIAAKAKHLEGLLQANLARSDAEAALRNLLQQEGV